jgi:hypothetical protein
MINEMIEHVERIKKNCGNGNGHDGAVKPGQPARFTTAATVGDGLAQGDLLLKIVGGVPTEGYTKIENLQEKDKQLVPGNTIGSKHCLAHLDGVTMYRPTNWTEESFMGPVLVLEKENTVLHPVHGDITVPAGFTVSCEYQKEWDLIQKLERRARD